MDEKHKAVMRLVPLLKPYICSMLEKLVGLDYTLGAANNQLDMGFDRPPRYESIHSKQTLEVVPEFFEYYSEFKVL